MIGLRFFKGQVKSFQMQMISVQNMASVKKNKNLKQESDVPVYNIHQALKLTKSHAIAAFEESIDISVILNVDPKHGDQIVRGTSVMPYGLGKQARILVFTDSSMVEHAQAAGADLIGNKEILEQMKDGKFEFDKLIATVDAMSQLKPLARVLGPKGFMPNAKVGTLVKNNELEQAIKNAKLGSVTFRVDPGGNIHSPLGKVGFDDKRILGNLASLMGTLVEKKPSSLKGAYFLEAYMTSTMGPSWKIDIDCIDPRNRLYMLKNI